MFLVGVVVLGMQFEGRDSAVRPNADCITVARISSSTEGVAEVHRSERIDPFAVPFHRLQIFSGKQNLSRPESKPIIGHNVSLGEQSTLGGRAAKASPWHWVVKKYAPVPLDKAISRCLTAINHPEVNVNLVWIEDLSGPRDLNRDVGAQLALRGFSCNGDSPTFTVSPPRVALRTCYNVALGAP